MSSPVHDDGDKKTMYAPPWAREAQQQNEPPRRPDESAAIEEQLKHEPRWLSSQTTASTQQPEGPGQSSEEGGSGDASFDIEGAIQELWPHSNLEPTVMPPAPKAEISLVSLGMILRLIGAFGLVAGIAWLVTGVVRMSSPDRTFASALATMQFRPAGDSRNPTTATPLDAKTSGQGPAEPAPNELAQRWNGAAIASTTPEGTTPTSLPPAITRGFQPGPSIPPLAAPAKSRDSGKLAPDEIASLLKRGQDLIASGDLGGARLVLARVADTGDADAAFTLATTFDPDVLARLNIIGARPDPVKARTWYAKAAEQGSVEARRRLEQLDQR